MKIILIAVVVLAVGRRERTRPSTQEDGLQDDCQPENFGAVCDWSDGRW